MERLDPNEFMRLDKGSNRFRSITSPYAYRAHRLMGCVRKCVVACKHCKEHGIAGDDDFEYNPHTNKQQQRWLIGVIDRRVAETESAVKRLKILDFPMHVFVDIQKMNRNEDWGDPKDYDLDIIVDPDAGEFGFYTTIPRPKRALTEEEQKLSAVFETMGLLQKMVDFCNPAWGGVHDGDWHSMTSNDVAYGIACASCSNYYPYARSQPGFKCWSCRNGW